MKPVSGKELAKVVEKKGWALKRATGSHFIYGRPDLPDVVLSIPIHGSRDLKRGTQQSLMKQAGLSEDDLK